MPIQWDRVIRPLHPAVREGVTVRDCYSIGASCGVNPQTIAGILMGRIKPSEMIAEKIIPELGETVVKEIMEDFNPNRYYQFSELNQSYLYQDAVWMPVYKISRGDRILTDEDKWLIVSGVSVSEKSVRIFSGDIICAIIPRSSHLIVSKPKDIERIKGIKSAKMGKTLSLEREQSMSAKKFFSDFDNEEKKTMMFEEMMEKIKKER